MARFIDVVLPIPLEKTFTYSIDGTVPVESGMRVAVPFGKSKIYTGIVYSVHNNPPVAYEAKPVFEFLDQDPVVTRSQLQHWEWMASYYMCTLGEIIRAALPGPFLLESETVILRGSVSDIDENNLGEDEFLVLESLENRKSLRVQDVADLLEKKTVLPFLNRMMARGLVELKERLYEQYRPKTVRYLRLHPDFHSDESLSSLLDELNRAPKQREVILRFFQLEGSLDSPVPFSLFEKTYQVSRGVLDRMIEKGILESHYEQQDRIQFENPDKPLDLELNPEQQRALNDIKDTWGDKTVALLHGVTSSGKTELYIQLIKDVLGGGKQVLYLVPEIALTTQLIRRLQSHFGNQVAVYHSRYSQMERVETWNHIRAGSDKARITLGARSALFTPFKELGLLIVDEEHDASYKQFDPAPRYHARDAAIVLAEQWGAKVVLGSATPSVESYYNVELGKYGLSTIDNRYGEVVMPRVELIDLRQERRRKTLRGHFSAPLYDAISNTLQAGSQAILFQNRRGFAPVVSCFSCGHVPQCANCDVSLTYHRYNQSLRCHYCGYNEPVTTACAACGNPTLDTLGLGTEQVAEELGTFFPEARIERMDYDTTRGKNAYFKIIEAFENREIDILVGTQMVTKGLDFRRVDLVGVMNADTLLNFPDFKAHERCYQLLTQVAGRAGRTDTQGQVLIQTYSPEHPILNFVQKGDYSGMYARQISERAQFLYPPVTRIIKITFKHRNYEEVDQAATWFASAVRQVIPKGVLGPESPSVGRIRNQFIKQLLIKYPREVSPRNIKNSIKRIDHSFNAISRFRAVRIIYDVDYL